MRSASPSRACGTSSCRPEPCGRGSSGRRRSGRTALRASRAGTSPRARASRGALTSWSPSVRRLQRIHPGLDSVDMLARAVELVLLDLRVLRRPGDLGRPERVAEDQVAVDDRELVAVKGTHGRAGDAVPLRVVRAAVAGADEAGRGEARDQRHVAALRLEGLLLVLAERPAGLDRAAEMRAAVGDARVARLAVEEAVVADER